LRLPLRLDDRGVAAFRSDRGIEPAHGGDKKQSGNGHWQSLRLRLRRSGAAAAPDTFDTREAASADPSRHRPTLPAPG